MVIKFADRSCVGFITTGHIAHAIFAWQLQHIVKKNSVHPSISEKRHEFSIPPRMPMLSAQTLRRPIEGQIL
jgi:hypothetical protein